MAQYWTSKTRGFDTNPGSYDFPKKTVNSGIGLLYAGDELNIEDGTYDEQIMYNIRSGTSGARITIRAVNRNQVIILPTSPQGDYAVLNSDAAYITTDGLVIDALYCTNNGGYYVGYNNPTECHDWIIKNGTIRNTTRPPSQSNYSGNGVALGFESYGHQVLNNDIYNCGYTYHGHGVYLSAHDSIVAFNRVRNCEGYGIQNYSSGHTTANNNVIAANTVYYCGLAGNFDTGGMVIASGQNTLVIDNIIWGCWNGLQVRYSGVGAKIYNNTVHGNMRLSMHVGAGCSATVRNNIFTRNGTDTPQDDTGAAVINTNMVGGDPLFVSDGDFHLQGGSPAIGAGVNLYSVFTTDAENTTRSSSGAWDLGALAYKKYFYASQSGGGTGASQSSPFRVSDFWAVAEPGSTLWLLDGVYTGSSSMISLPSGLNGTANARITIRAVNDGAVLINGQGVRVPLEFSSNDYWTFQGFNCANSGGGPVVDIGTNTDSTNNEFKRMCAWNADPTGNYHVWSVHATNTLLEDCAGFGTGRKAFDNITGNGTVFRRCWGRFEYTQWTAVKQTATVTYDNFNTLVENCIFTWDQQPGTDTTGMEGILVSGPHGSATREIFFDIKGTIVYLPSGKTFNPDYFVIVARKDEININNLAVVVPSDQSGKIPIWVGNCKLSDVSPTDCSSPNLNLSNTSLIGGAAPIIESQWVQSNVKTGATVGAVYTAGSLFQNDGAKGATIAFRYVNGVLTDTPLWPWPMNARIIAALTTAGKTPIDVTATIQSIFGTIPTTLLGSGGSESSGGGTTGGVGVGFFEGGVPPDTTPGVNFPPGVNIPPYAGATDLGPGPEQTSVLGAYGAVNEVGAPNVAALDPEWFSAGVGKGIKVKIDNGTGIDDYTPWVEPQSIKIEDLINQPTVANFTVTNYSKDFVVPRRGAYVSIVSSKYKNLLATGFVSSEPEKTFIGGSGNKNNAAAYMSYNVSVTSDEWLLNVKTLPFLPAYVNQTMGSILRLLAEALVPDFYTFDVDDGDVVPLFKYDPKKQWSELAKDFADSIRYRYKVIGRVIYFKPYGDDDLGVSYDDDLPNIAKSNPNRQKFNPRTLETSVFQTPVINDAIVVGDVEPHRIREDHFIGTGIDDNFILRHKVFGGTTALLLEEKWDDGSEDEIVPLVSNDRWEVLDPDNRFEMIGALNVLAGSFDAPLGTAYIKGKNGLELSGHLDLDHGEFEFVPAISGAPFDSGGSPGSGIIGGVYNDSNLVLSTCETGFFVSGDQGTIHPVVLGEIGDALITIDTNKHYRLQTIISVKNWSRYNKVFRTLDGDEFGGDALFAYAYVTFLVEEIDLSTPGKPVITKLTEEISLSAFGLYAPINTINLQVVVFFTQIAKPVQATLMARSLYGPYGDELPVRIPGNEEHYMLGFGLNNQTATIEDAREGLSLSFYEDSIPAVGSRIRLRSWESGRAIAHVRDEAAITGERVIVGDDGVRSAIVTELNPLPRTSEDCDEAAHAFIKDRSETQYNGSYAFTDEFWDGFIKYPSSVPAPGGPDWPRTGRYFSLNTPMRNIAGKNYLVRKVLMQVDELDIEKIVMSIEFGPDLFLPKLLHKFIRTSEEIMLPKDIAEEPLIQSMDEIGTAFLPDLVNARLIGLVTGTEVTVSIEQALSGNSVEVRRVDSGWGRTAQNRITIETAQTFTLQRTAIEQTWYLRIVGDGKTSRRTTALRVVYPLIPSAPTGSLDTRDWLHPEVHLQIPGDIRNLWGIEIRSCMNEVSVGTLFTLSCTTLSSGETYLEILDLGLGSGVADTTYARSAFYIATGDGVGYDDDNVEMFIEGVVVNLDAVDRTITIYGTSRAVGGSAVAGTLVIPAGFQGRLRSSTPFVRGTTTSGGIDYLHDKFTVTMPAVTVGNHVLAYKLRIVVIHDNVAKMWSEICLSNYFDATSLDQTIGGGDIFRTTSYGLQNDTSGFVSVGMPRFRYEAAAWATVTSIIFTGVVANASFHLDPGDVGRQWTDLALYDVTASALVHVMQCQDAGMFLNPTLFISSLASLATLTDGHVYEVQMRSVKQNAGQLDFNSYFHKARMFFSVSPIDAVELHGRFGDAPGVSESRGRWSTIVPDSDVLVELHGTVGTFYTLKDYGTSDTSSVGTIKTFGDLLIENTTRKFERSQDIAQFLVEGNRYAMAATQGSLVTRFPRVTPVFPLDASTPRRQWVKYLFEQGFMPILAVLFEEGTGTPVEFIHGSSMTVGGAASWTTDPTYGVAGRAANTTDYWTVNNVGLYVPTERCTIFVIRKKADATKRDSNLVGLYTDFFGRWIGMNIPVSTGGLARWNIGSNDQTVAFTVSTNVETLAAKFGPTGRAIWRDGASIVSDATVLTRTASNSTDGFGINIATSNYSNGDKQDFYMVLVVRGEVPDSILALFTASNVLLGM